MRGKMVKLVRCICILLTFSTALMLLVPSGLAGTLLDPVLASIHPTLDQTDDTGEEYFYSVGPTTIHLYHEDSSYEDDNWLIWYVLSDLGACVVFEGSDGVSTTKTILMDGYWGLYVQSPEGNMNTQPSLNSDGCDHAMVFRHPSDPLHCIIVAFEDMDCSHWDKSFDDMVIVMNGTFPRIAPVGGIWTPLNKLQPRGPLNELQLMGPWIGLASLITVATTVVYVKRRKKEH